MERIGMIPMSPENYHRMTLVVAVAFDSFEIFDFPKNPFSEKYLPLSCRRAMGFRAGQI